MREQTNVRFKISSSSLSAADIQAKIGLEPDETWKAGDKRGAFGAVEKQHGFVLKSKEPPHATLEEHVKAMLARLAPSAQRVGALANEATIEFICELHRKAAPPLHFARDDLRWLGVMGARLDVDVFTITDPAAKAAAAAPPKTGAGGGTGGGAGGGVFP